MSKRSNAQRAADTRYEATRSGAIIPVRVSCEQSAWLDARRKPGESRPKALRRLAQMPSNNQVERP